MKAKDLHFKEQTKLNDIGKNTAPYQVMRCEKGVCRTSSHELIGEEPLLIRIDDKPYSVVMRTPGEELFHAAGFCLGEGIANSPDDFNAIGYCKDLDPNVIDIRLKPERREKIPDLLERRGFVSQTSCGICGKEMVKDLYQILTPAEHGFKVDVNAIFNCIGKLEENQQYYQRTRGSHAALIFDRELQMMSFAEDVGRHNALDKAIGKALLEDTLDSAALAILSSRISYELVQKAARARIPAIFALSRPTALAVDLAAQLNMTIATLVDNEGLYIFCGAHRLNSKPSD